MYMTKKLLIVLLSFSLLGQSKVFSQDTIHWRPDYKLKWEDFRGTVPNTNLQACTPTGMHPYVLNSNSDKPTLNVKCYFLTRNLGERIVQAILLIMNKYIFILPNYVLEN